MVTASTVGYGDMSPVTPFGKLVVMLWVIPVGLSIFALLITKFGMFIGNIIIRKKRGLNMINLENHIVIIGYQALRTARLIELLQPKQQNRQIVLCTMYDMENPFPGLIHFAKVSSFSNHQMAKQLNLDKAKSIIIDTTSDDLTLSTALFCNTINPGCYKTAYIQDDSIEALLNEYCPKIEIVPSVSVEMLAKSSTDPDSSQLHKELLDNTQGMTQYSYLYNKTDVLDFSKLFQNFKRNSNATIIGIKFKGEEKIKLNPSLDCNINQGDVLFYIAEHRISDKHLENNK